MTGSTEEAARLMSRKPSGTVEWEGILNVFGADALQGNLEDEMNGGPEGRTRCPFIKCFTSKPPEEHLMVQTGRLAEWPGGPISRILRTQPDYVSWQASKEKVSRCPQLRKEH